MIYTENKNTSVLVHRLGTAVREALALPHFFGFYFLRTKTFVIPLEALLLPPRRRYWYLEGGSSSASEETTEVIQGRG